MEDLILLQSPYPPHGAGLLDFQLVYYQLRS